MRHNSVHTAAALQRFKSDRSRGVRRCDVSCFRSQCEREKLLRRRRFSRAADEVKGESEGSGRRTSSLFSGHGQRCGDQENASPVPNGNSRETNLSRIEIADAFEPPRCSSKSIRTSLFPHVSRTKCVAGRSAVQRFHTGEKCQRVSNIVSGRAEGKVPFAMEGNFPFFFAAGTSC